MTEPALKPQSNGLRIAGIILTVVGGLILLSGVAYAVAYYATTGFFDGPTQLADLGPGNLGVAGSGLCCGGIVAVVGVVMLLRARRR